MLGGEVLTSSGQHSVLSAGRESHDRKDETHFHLRKAVYDLSFLELILLEYFFGTQKESFDSASQ